jgi:hypothetical protein
MPTAAYNKFEDYAEQVNRAVHNWGTHTFKAALTNSAPLVGFRVLADVTEIGAGNGYSAGGMTLDSVTLTESNGEAKLTIADEVLTASGGSIGPFRYVVIYNDTSASDNLVCFFDYGSSITLQDTETFTIDFSATAGLWTFQ